MRFQRFDRSNPVVRGLAALTAGVFLATTVDLALAAPARADAREELTKAEDYFLVADFQTALDKVNGLLGSGELRGGALRDAWILKARCEVGLAHRSAAVDAFCEVLRLESSWRPDPDFYTKDEMEIFEQARGSCKIAPGDTKREDAPPPTPRTGGGEPFYKNKWVLIGAGALVVGAVAAAASGGGDDESDPPLPDFPDPPAG